MERTHFLTFPEISVEELYIGEYGFTHVLDEDGLYHRDRALVRFGLGEFKSMYTWSKEGIHDRLKQDSCANEYDSYDFMLQWLAKKGVAEARQLVNFRNAVMNGEMSIKEYSPAMAVDFREKMVKFVQEIVDLAYSLIDKQVSL